MANKPWKYRSTDYWENDAIGGLHFHQQISITRWRSKCYLDGSTYKVNIRKTAFTSNKPCVDFEKRVVYVELPQKVLSSLPKCPDASSGRQDSFLYI